jgi:hypothetical protein
MSSLAQWARSHAEGLLAPLSNRWAHVQAVAEQAVRIAPAVLPADEREILVAAAWLHDIGYAPALATTGLHPLDGARHLDLATSVNRWASAECGEADCGQPAGVEVLVTVPGEPARLAVPIGGFCVGHAVIVGIDAQAR